MPKQTIASIRGQIEQNRGGELRDPDGYLKGLPSGDPRLEWTLRLYDEGRPVLSLRRVGDSGRVGLIQPGSFGYWGGSVFVDGEQVRLRCDDPQPDRLHVALHLYGLAIQLLNTEDGADAEAHNQKETGAGGDDSPQRTGAGSAAAGDGDADLAERSATGAVLADASGDAAPPAEGGEALHQVGVVDDQKVDGVK